MDSDLNSQVYQWAARQLADYDQRQPGTVFSEGVSLSLEDADLLQTAVADLRAKRGERIIGYKVGCTSPTIRSQLGIDHSVTGRLFESESHVSGARLSRSDFANLAIEGELAVELRHEPSEWDFSGNGIPSCVARVFPVIELHHHVIRGERLTAEELIANNAFQAGFVAGEGVAREDLDGDPSLAIYANDRLLDSCEGSALVETISSSLKWLMATMRNRGDRLGAGQVILTGSVPGLHAVNEACRLRVEAPPFGSVEATVTD